MSKNNNNNYNEDICKMLLELGENEKNVNQNIYKYNAYRKAVISLSNHNKRIETLSEAKQLTGIGDKIAKKIIEFLNTGSVESLINVKNNTENNGIKELMRVSGIGPVFALKLVNEGIVSIEQLKKHLNLLTNHQKIGLKYLEEFEEKIPRKVIQNIENIIRAEINKWDKNILLTICGSYRREKEYSGDIDVLVTHSVIKSNILNTKRGSILNELIKRFQKIGFITDSLSSGDTKFMGVCQTCHGSKHRRIDIRFLTIDQYFCGVLYFTGSDLFNKEMRTHAQQKGFILNEYSLRRLGITGVPGEPIPITSEEEIFDYIDYPFKKPKERNF